MTLSYLADIVTLIAGAMTILGLSGLLSWSYFHKNESPLSERVLTIFAYSIKTSLACVLTYYAYWLWSWFYLWLLVDFWGSALHMAKFYWNQEEAPRYLFAYFFSLALFVPLYVSSVIALYSSSFVPIKRLAVAIFKKNSESSNK
ncbi:hypothetical protein [Thiocystis violascens]|uniref:Uncharacterized protein n=1 Tax=Thiocystis violascens (strain ATCC 17096 / DSM 198 / 6111) TaxID=765911 RepID=I3Y8E0_THIV6|nr:hypothetical protein [Thiocystis violascens]AFL73258.1 hypothetical protein Thivi_1235 [Thiocystis violascens DSM 198]